MTITIGASDPYRVVIQYVSAMRWFLAGMPVSDVLRDYDQFAVSFDTRLRNPRWCVNWT